MSVKKISMDIPMDDYTFLKDSNINMTELFKVAIEKERIQSKKKVSSLMFLASMMGMVFSVVLIAIGLTPSPISNITRGILCITGGVMAVSTMILYVREKRE